MSYLFYIDEKNLTILNPDCVKLVPEIAPLMQSEEKLKYVILVYDYDSPFKQWPIDDRKRKAINRVWGDAPPKNLETDKVLNVAIEAYKSLQYDTKRELIATYERKIQQIESKIEDEDNEKKLTEYASTIDKFRKYVKALEHEVFDDKMQEGQIKGGQELYWLEKMQKKRDIYLSLQETKKKKDVIPSPPVS